MTVRFRLHPLDALFLWRRYVLLLAIPLLRGIGTGGRGFFLRLQELWIYVLLLALIVWVADRSRQTNTLCTAGDRLIYSCGFFRPMRRVCAVRALSAVHITHPLLLRCFGAVLLRPQTAVGYRIRPLLLAADDAALLSRIVFSEPRERIRPILHPRPAALALAAVASSDLLGGLTLAVTLISGSVRYFGEQTAGLVWQGLASILRTLSHRLPFPAALPFFGLFLLYGGEFLRNFAQYFRFSVSRSPQTLCVAGGMFTRRHLQIRLAALFSLELRCGLLTRFGLGARVYVDAPGFAHAHLLIPARSAAAALRALRRLLPELSSASCPIRTDPAKDWFRSTADSLCLLLSLPFVCALADVWAPTFAPLIGFWSIVATFFLLRRLLCRLIALWKTGIGVYPDYLVLSCFARARFHRIWIPRTAVVRITVIQSARQARLGVCHVRIDTALRRHTIHTVDAAAVRNAFTSVGYPL